MASTSLKVGDQAPDFMLPAANDVYVVQLSYTLREEAPVVLEFLRGTWCPNCRKRMALLEENIAQFAHLGVKLICVAAEKRHGLFMPEEFFAKHEYHFPFLLDESREVTKAYGVWHRISIDALNIAHPATFVIGRDGIIRYIYVGKHQLDRAPLEQVFEAVRLMNSEKTNAEKK
jgi:peroxiredoxin Q/BCP